MLYSSLTSDLYGHWIGANAAITITPEFTAAFLRIKQDKIVSVLHHRQHGLCVVVCGHGEGWGTKAVWCGLNLADGSRFYPMDDQAEALSLWARHEGDEVSLENGMLTYVSGGTTFSAHLAEAINPQMFHERHPADPALPVEERMRRWNVFCYFESGPDRFHAGIGTHLYAINFDLNPSGNFIYCRVGQNGYCRKGWAMRSTVCLRMQECRMLADHLQALAPYQPVEDCFVENGCAFPPDGGWYWSLREATDDYITLNGCGGDIYRITRK